jgi:predicted transposase YbfD/YdcC
MGREKISIWEYFSEVETTSDHNGYFCSVGEALTIVILGSLCGLRNTNQIHQWASSHRVSEFLSKYFLIKVIPCYYWLLCLLKLIKPESLNQCFIKWAQRFMPDKVRELTISFDGKTIRSTGRMDKYTSPLHIVSAQLAELGLTIGQQTVEDKSNEIPAVRELLEMLRIEGCLVVADALHCQKETAEAIIKKRADYLLNVKDNQGTLQQEIEDYVQDEGLRKGMDTNTTCEKNSGRVERRTAYTSCDIGWLYGKEEWAGLQCIGAVNTKFSSKKGTTDEWHYYISSRKLSAEELLRHARLEWSVETMHWLLDVHFHEDFCRVEDRNVQQNLNMVRKIALNSIRDYKEKTGSKDAISKIMLGCLIDCENLVSLLDLGEN